MPERIILGRDPKKGWLFLVSQQEAGPQRINDATHPDLGCLIHSLSSPFHKTLISGHGARSQGARRIHKQEGRMFELQKKADPPLVVYKLYGNHMVSNCAGFCGGHQYRTWYSVLQDTQISFYKSGGITPGSSSCCRAS